jgi:hypothetical protein
MHAVLAALAPLALAALPQDGGAGQAPAPGEEEPAGGVSLVFAPGDLLYRDYVADPRRPTFGISALALGDAGIAAAGDSRYAVRMGARFGLLRLEDAARAPLLQLDGHVGFYGQFDRDDSTDNLGWDGFYGLDLAVPAGRRWLLQLGLAHDSAHLGDEYMEETGAERLDYTRLEYNLGARFAVLPDLSAYGEYGYGFELRNEDLQEPGRAQGGLEGELDLPFAGLRGYAGLNLDAYEEDGWSVNRALQLGVRSRAEAQVWRLFLELYDGRSPMGEHFQAEESWAGVGLTLDL